MKLFTINKTDVTEIEQLPFKLEKEIQSLVEQNTGSMFGLRFILSEFSVDKYRLDTLCYDEENNSFVIIEYKKGNSYSVIDQGYTYLQLLLNNKSDFLLVLSQHFNKVMRLEDIDWSQSKIIFVAPSFNSYQKDSVNFKDLPFELWEIKRYSNETLVFNQHKSSSKESIDALSSAGKQSVISNVNKEVKVYTDESHFAKTSKVLVEKYFDFADKLLELDDAELIAKKPYISLMVNGKTVCFLTFRKKHIIIEILRGNVNPDGSTSKNYFNLDDPKGISVEGEWTWKSGVRGTLYKIKLNETSDLDYLMFLVKQKYKAIVE